MRGIWHTGEDDVIRLQGDDIRFAELLNDLVNAQIDLLRIPLSDRDCTLRTKDPDGGADAAIHQSHQPGMVDETGWFGVRTCWQYKATEASKVKPKSKKKGQTQKEGLREEVNKPFAKSLVSQGYGYRLCIADGFPSKKKNQWEDWLREAIHEFAPDAPDPKVLTADDLKNWVNRFPAIATRFKPVLEGSGLRTLETWGPDLTSLTEKFVLVDSWKKAISIIQNHVDFSQKPSFPILSIQGEAGVGKTRCVYEALNQQKSQHNSGFVVYTSDETKAEDLADLLASDSHTKVILVSDECGIQSKVRLERLIRSHTDRIRIIAIDNSFQEEPSVAGSYICSRPSVEDVHRILEVNFPDLPFDQRRAFSDLSGGFIRLAVDLYDHRHLIPESGHIHDLVPYFRDHYLNTRLVSDEERSSVLAISLLPRIGFKADIKDQLVELAKTLDLDANRIIEIARRLKQSPGFIAIGERYLYITPRLITQAAFQLAWAKWIRDREETFFAKMSSFLLEGFVIQLKEYGTEGMKAKYFDFFRQWVEQLQPGDLGREYSVRLLSILTETNPDRLLPRLAELVHSVSHEQLKELHSSNEGEKARRTLVWLMDKLIRFPEHFHDCESILFHLAMSETESYANNASEIWKVLFRPYLSGTGTDFQTRITLLEKRFRSAETMAINLCFGALAHAVEIEGPIYGRVLSSPLVGGRIPPEDWYPQNQLELARCWDSTIQLIKQLAASGNTAIRSSLSDFLIAHLTVFLLHSTAELVQEILRKDRLTDLQLSSLLREIDTFSAVFCKEDAPRSSKEVAEVIRQWRISLVPNNLHGQLVDLVGRNSWEFNLLDDMPTMKALSIGDEKLSDLARTCLAQSQQFLNELNWLCSPEARNANWFGERLAKEDMEGSFLIPILQTAIHSDYPSLGMGYLRGIAKFHREYIQKANDLLDQHQMIRPRSVIEMALTPHEEFRGLERLIQLIDNGKLPVEFLGGIRFALNRMLRKEELDPILQRLIHAAKMDNSNAAKATLNLLWSHMRPVDQSPENSSVIEAIETEKLYEILDLSIKSVGREAYEWKDLLTHFGKRDIKRAIDLAVRALVSDEFVLARFMGESLKTFANQSPSIVVERLGQELIGPKRWRLAFDRLHHVIQSIPVSIIEDWLIQHGVQAAKAIARHIPAPFLTDQGEPQVPPLTELFLTRFANDEEIFAEFCRGVHSGETNWGSILDICDRRIRTANFFLQHPIKRVREWAENDIDYSTREIAREKVTEEEFVTSPY